MAPRLLLISKLSLVWPPQTSWEVGMGTKGEKAGASAVGLEGPPSPQRPSSFTWEG